MGQYCDPSSSDPALLRLPDDDDDDDDVMIGVNDEKPKR